MSAPNQLRVALIGAGNIGAKRVAALSAFSRDLLLWVYDTNIKKAKELAGQANARVAPSLDAILRDREVNVVVCAATPDANFVIAQKALSSGKHVLIEKPAGFTKTEAQKLLQVVKKSKKILKVGYNHRHHPAIAKAHHLYTRGAIGKLLFIRAVYGHGARKDYDLQWRMQKKFSPGGELYDQGVHIIDLSAWFAGPFVSSYCLAKNLFWHRSDLEDNAFCQLVAKSGAVVDFHVSVSLWKNTFQYQIFGEKGYLVIQGLGRSYGLETLTYGKNIAWGKPSREQVWQFPGPDISWEAEWKAFRKSIFSNTEPPASAQQNLIVCQTLEGLYQSARLGKIVRLK